MLDTENMQIVSRLLAITLERWCSHRAAKKDQSIAAAEGLPQGGGAAEALPRSGAPSEVLTPLVRIGHQKFILHSILPVEALEECTLP